MFIVNPGFYAPVNRIKKIIAVVLYVKTENIVAEQAIEQFFAPGENAESLPVGPGYMPELHDFQIRPAVSQKARQQRKMIVLNKNNCRIAFGLLKHGIAKALIDAFIYLPVAAGKMRPRVDNMAQGPERFIGQAIIISILFLAGKPDTSEHIFG